MPSVLVADLECDSLKPSTIHMVGILDYFSDEFTSYHGDNVADGLLAMEAADALIVYNGLGYDLPVIKKLTNGLVDIDQRKVIEVLKLSKKFAALENHKLKTWGNLFDFPKGDHTDFTRFSEEMKVYCERDCRLTKKVFDLLNEISIERGNRCIMENFRP